MIRTITRTLVVSTLGLVPVGAQTASPIPASARPFNLDIANQVQLGGSDARSADFMVNTLPTFQTVVNQNLREQQSLDSRARSQRQEPRRSGINPRFGIAHDPSRECSSCVAVITGPRGKAIVNC